MKAILFLSLIALAGACVDQTDARPDIESQDVPRLASNGMTPAQLVPTSLNTAALTGAAINSLAQTTDGRTYLTYLVGCALDGTQSVTSTTTPTSTFTGSIGLATSWTSGALSTADRHWVSACMLARANSTGQTISISMRGTHAQLYVSESGYGLQEASFYGDIFTGSNNRHACVDVDGVNRPSYLSLKNRICGRDVYDQGPGGGTPCGFVFDGACASICSQTGQSYTTCTAYDTSTWAEVIKIDLLST